MTGYYLWQMLKLLDFFLKTMELNKGIMARVEVFKRCGKTDNGLQF
jgi:hypothetical protein